MKTEFEAKFTKIEKEEIRKKLMTVGANLVSPERITNRETFDFPDLRLHHQQDAWLRVRDEGNKITLTYKSFKGEGIRGVKEINLDINSYENMVSILQKLGMKRKSLQEQKREKWVYKEIEITIDTWPGLDPYIEIEGRNEKSVRQLSELLGFKWEDAVFGGVAQIYERELGLDPKKINLLPEITFANPPKP